MQADATAPEPEPDGVHEWETEIGKGVASLIVPGVFLGDRVVAAGPCAEFSAVLNITERCENYHEARLQYLRIAVDDKETVDLAARFEEMCDFIERHHSGGVLVHCQSGMSRSGAAVLAYLMMWRGYSLREAWSATQAARPMLLPNAGFFAQLQDLEREQLESENITSRSRTKGTVFEPTMSLRDYSVERLSHPYLKFERAAAEAALDACGGDYSDALEKLLEAREREETDAEPKPEPEPALALPRRLHSGTVATPVTVATAKGIIFREDIGRESAKVAKAKVGESVDILSLQRTETGTLRAETTKGWTTASTRDGRGLLQAAESREQRVARLSQQLEPEPEPEPGT
jgi:hypothetical protein